MSYAVIDDIFKRYPPIVTIVGVNTYEVASVDVSSIYLADAEDYVNAFLAARYVIPLSPESLLTQVTCDIALYRLLEDKAPRVPDMMAKRWANANSLLTMLREGVMRLTASSTQVTSGGDQDAWSSSQDTPPIFSPVESYAQSYCLVDSDNFISNA
jgi:phage gp36-like protein